MAKDVSFLKVAKKDDKDQEIKQLKKLVRQIKNENSTLKGSLKGASASARSLQKKNDELKKLSIQIQDQIAENQSLDEIIKEKRELIEKVELLELNDLTPKNITYLVKIIKDISEDYNLSRSVALSRFIREIKANYQTILGFREEIKKLEKQISNLKNMKNQQKKEFNSIQEKNDLRKEALRAMGTINDLGISDGEIVNLKNYLTENENVLNELRARATIKDDIKKMKEIIEHLEKDYKKEDSSSITISLNILEAANTKLIDLLNKIEKTTRTLVP
jgi:DNA repair exonuclease SbcCD ATPase subunit